VQLKRLKKKTAYLELRRDLLKFTATWSDNILYQMCPALSMV